MVRKIGWFLSVAVALVAILILSGCFHSQPNILPIANFSAEFQHGYEYAPLAILFDATDSYDPDGRIASYSWDFGDGETGASSSVSHTYDEPGSYPVTLRVLDNRGGEDTSSCEIVIPTLPSGNLLCHYEWEYQGNPQYWEVLLPEDLYQYYHGQQRHPLIDNYNYGDYVIDPLDEPTIEDLAKELWARVENKYESFVECTLSFVQGVIWYTTDPPGLEYPLYPLETLVDGVGDCEDTTILYVSLVRAMGYSVSMAFVDTDGDHIPDHVLALVPVSSSYADAITCSQGTAKGVWEIDGKIYALAETVVDTAETGYIPLGCDPWGLEEGNFIQIWKFP